MAGAVPVTRASARLVDDLAFGDLGGAIHPLDHVHHRECRHGDGGQRLHLNTGAIRCADRRADGHAVIFQRHVHRSPVHADGVREGKQFRNLLGRGDSCDPRLRQNIALGNGSLLL